MGELTRIAWCDSTFNAWIGCQKVSEGCKNCYAEVSTSARVSKAKGLPLWGPNSHRQVTSPANWKLPLKWNREAAAAGERRRVFCSSLSDVFEDRPDLAGPRARLFTMIASTPHLDWLLLTKRPENANRLWSQARDDAFRDAQDDAFRGDEPANAVWLPNVWLGTTVENQKAANERIPHLLATPAAVRFLSVEPQIEAVDLCRWVFDRRAAIRQCMNGPAAMNYEQADATISDVSIHWVIVGGESGHGARPFDIAWARRIVADCKAHDVPCFVKQLGAKPRKRCEECGGSGKLQPHQDTTGQLARVRCTACDGAGDDVVPVRDSHGGNMSEWPADLRVREFPRPQ